MDTPERQQRLASERQMLAAAEQRLLAGTPSRSDGALTVAALAREAGLSRARVYEHHPETLRDFRAHTGRAPATPAAAALQAELDTARRHIDELEQDNARLRGQIETLCAVLSELSQNADADNVVPIPAAGPRSVPGSR